MSAQTRVEPTCEFQHVTPAPVATHEAVGPHGKPYLICAVHAASTLAARPGREAGAYDRWEVVTLAARDAAPTRLLVVSSNVPGYLSENDDPAVVHAHVGPNATNYQIRQSALELVSIMAELVIRDGESSAEVADLEVTSEGDTEGQLAAAGDHGEVEGWMADSSADSAFNSSVAHVMTALRADAEFIESVQIAWTMGLLSYFIARSPDALVCSDESCDVCYADVPAL